MQHNLNRLLFLSFLILAFFISCKKKDSNSDIIDDKVKDTTISYAREIYLWYAQIPSTFNARNYADPDKIMQAIRPYSVEPGFTSPVDHYSFGMKQAEWNNLSNGISADFGLGVFFYSSTDLRVKSVERDAPAGKTGIKRGWRITKINGNSSVINSADPTNVTTVSNAVFASASTAFTFLKPDGSSVDITLTSATYNTHPVMVDSVYTAGTKKIGYLLFNSFLGDQTEINNELSRVFTRFATYAVTDVVVDLRYNGGGYVSIAEKLSDYLAPTTTTGLMMTQKYNDKYASKYNTTANFSKAGTVNVPRVIFIVSSSTASASELLINNLTPVMDVKLVGRNNTYGKPVGFFPIAVGDWYIFPVSFRTVNRLGNGNYFSGFTPDAIIADGLDKNWGDITEASLASAIKYITTGSFRLQSQPTYREEKSVTDGNTLLESPTFKGAVTWKKEFK